MSAPLLEVEGLRMHFFTRAGVVKAVDDTPDSADGRSNPRSMEGATRRKRAVASKATIHTTSNSSDRAIARQVHSDERMSPEISAQSRAARSSPSS